MCGIVGAAAQRDVTEILLEGLRRLEYRGYDSAGIAIIDPVSSTIQRQRVHGKVARLADTLHEHPLHGSVGIAHTRWATHGVPSEANAHPHVSGDQIAVVHNGIIENHSELRKKLQDDGYHFHSETDSEVIGHLLDQALKKEKDILVALRQVTNQLSGAYSLGIIFKDMPNTLYAVRRGSSLVIGVGIGEHFIASDIIALLPVTQQFMYLEDGDIAQITTQEVLVQNESLEFVQRKIHKSELDPSTANKGPFRHFMLKEIHDQARVIADTLEGHIYQDHLLLESFGPQVESVLRKIKRIKIVACGTSYHAGLVARYWIEEIAKLPCQVEIASEQRYRSQIVEADTLLVAISQSGETADTLAALRQAKQEHFSVTLAICNNSESALAREADIVIPTRAGVEIGVAATKTFTTQLTALFLLTLILAKLHNSSFKEENYIKTLEQLPRLIQEVLSLDKNIQELAAKFTDKRHALFLGRGAYYPIALEGALKLKEISYMHAEAYPAGELKHGPLALVDKEMPVIVLAPNNNLYEKLASNIEEVQARGGEIYIISDEKLKWGSTFDHRVIYLPTISSELGTILYTIPLQLLSYHIAVIKGTDVDQPRNLAKSVTVE